MNAGKRKALGRGLAALIGDAAPAAPRPDARDNRSATAASRHEPGMTPAAGPATTTRRTEGLAFVAIEDIGPSSLQPRRKFDDGKLDELAESIRTQGIIEPLVVRVRAPRKSDGTPTRGDGTRYEIIAGERRWRAAQRAGLRELPVIIKDVTPTRAFEIALVENLQREDLNPIEEAEGFERLISEFGYKQEILAARVGKDRSTVANALRLLKLPGKVREMVIDGRLSMGHARALLGLDNAVTIEHTARLAIAKNLSVRAVEALVKKARDGGTTAGEKAQPAAGAPKKSVAARDLELRLQRALGTRVNVIEGTAGAGQLEIFFHSLDELDRLLTRLLPS